MSHFAEPIYIYIYIHTCIYIYIIIHLHICRHLLLIAEIHRFDCGAFFSHPSQTSSAPGCHRVAHERPHADADGKAEVKLDRQLRSILQRRTVIDLCPVDSGRFPRWKKTGDVKKNGGKVGRLMCVMEKLNLVWTSEYWMNIGPLDGLCEKWWRFANRPHS